MGQAATKQAELTDQWMDLAEAAVYCKMSRSSLEKHIAHGRLRPDSPSRPGFRKHRMRRSTLDRFMTLGVQSGQEND